MGQLSVCVLGAPDLRYDGRTLSFPTRKTQALLVYLAVEGGLQQRDKLTALLWPESDQERGRRSLRSALVLLRGALRRAGDDGATLAVRRDSVALAPGATLAVDCHALQGAAGLARQSARIARQAW